MTVTPNLLTRKRLLLSVAVTAFLVSLVSCGAGLSAFFDEDRNPVQRITVVKKWSPARMEIMVSVLTWYGRVPGNEPAHDSSGEHP